MSKRDRKFRKKKERERKVAKAKIRQREERRVAERNARFEEIRNLLASGDSPAPGGSVSRGENEDAPPGSRESEYDAERFNRYMWKAALEAGLDPYDLAGAEERALIEDWEEKREEMLERDPVELAHEIALQALEEAELSDDDWEGSKRVQLDMAEEALKLDPGNVDAQVIRGRLAFDESEEEGYDLLREAVRKGREALGPGFLAAHGSRTGTRVEARPFLRALDTLAFHLETDHRFEEAMPHLLELHELGAPRKRWLHRSLLDASLCLGRTDVARRLLRESSDQFGPATPWAWILVDLLEGRPDAAARALPGALKECPGVPHALMDDTLADPARISEPVPEEILAAFPVTGVIGRAWRRVPGARDWLREATRQGSAPAGGLKAIPGSGP
jgi:hypothetical protein